MSVAPAPTERIETRCCIVGGGPAGMMLAYLLARAGVDVVVLEKHADFLRDFRGDTVHPSTLEVMYELGILGDFLKRPHEEVQELHGVVGQFEATIADFRHLPTHCKFVALMPQWDFLNFLASQVETQEWWRAPGSSQYAWGKGFQYKAKRCYNLAQTAIKHGTEQQEWSAKKTWREIYGIKYPE